MTECNWKKPGMSLYTRQTISTKLESYGHFGGESRIKLFFLIIIIFIDICIGGGGQEFTAPLAPKLLFPLQLLAARKLSSLAGREAQLG